MTTVRIGIYVPQLAFGYDEMLERARNAERLGFDSFWLYDHLYTPHLPDMPAFEGWTLATALLTETERLRVGHMVLCATFRHPALLGKMATTLDVISNGRLNVGIGSGSYDLEHHEAGIPWDTLAYRSEILEETLEIVTSMFANEKTTFAGNHFQVQDLPNLPLPVQQPRPPIYIGGIGEKRTLPLVARFADVWHSWGSPKSLADANARIDQLATEAGRDPASIMRAGSLSLDDVDTAKRHTEKFVEAGYGYLVCGWPGDGEKQVEAFVNDVLPEFRRSWGKPVSASTSCPTASRR